MTELKVYDPIQVKLFDKDGHPYTGNTEPPKIEPPMSNAFPTEVVHEGKTFIFDSALSFTYNAPSYRLMADQQ